MKCPACLIDIPPNSRFCSECGVALPIGCPSCGNINQPKAKFCSECGTRLTTNGNGATKKQGRPIGEAFPQAQTGPVAERRQLTVMFCDLVNSTSLARQLDPEDLHEVIRMYQMQVAEVAVRFSGFVAKYMGDGVLLYFGYPHAHEDDVEQAIQAGLTLADTVPRLDALMGIVLQVRVGIATGLVVVGDLIGTGAAQEQAVVGDTPNLAARLQALAEPGAVVIADSTRRIVGSLFEFHDLGLIALKGFAEPMRAWRVV